MNCIRMKELLLSRVLFCISVVFFCTLCQLTISARLHEPLPRPQTGEDFGEATVENGGLEEPLTATHELEPTDHITVEMHVVHHKGTLSDFKTSTTTESSLMPTTNVAPELTSEPPTPNPAPPVTAIPSAFPGDAPHMKDKYPKDLFSNEDHKRGWVILHIIGMIYMFMSLVLVCDEFFVPSVVVITDKLAVSDDVAGATIMAAGRSTLKFFSILIGVLIAHSNVGTGSIVGPAVYNMLFVTGISALFSREVLCLTWWPLFRDVSFYILHLILLIIFFLDNVIMWWESIMLVGGYTLYVIFMKFNPQIEQAFKTQLCKHKSNVKIIAVEEPEKDDMPAEEDWSGGSEVPDTDEGDNKKNSDYSSKNKDDETKVKEEEGQKDKPLSLKWPDTQREQTTYLFLLPIIFPLWLTLPDVRKQKSRKFFVITFLGSILWIGVFSYLIMWWSHQDSLNATVIHYASKWYYKTGQAGETLGIPDHIMTILVGGTANPDLITSVIVARKGLGDMAVSSSVGSNIFDITVGLPVPWLLYSFIHGLASVAVNSNGLVCACTLLFLMLLFAIIVVVSCKWKMNKVLGFTMVLLYFIFMGLSFMLQFRVIVCPVSVGDST